MDTQGKGSSGAVEDAAPHRRDGFLHLPLILREASVVGAFEHLNLNEPTPQDHRYQNKNSADDI
jgi:hypothetical protein